MTIELNHDAYMASVDYEKAGLLGWNGTGVPPTGRYWFAVSDNALSPYSKNKVSSPADLKFYIIFFIPK